MLAERGALDVGDLLLGALALLRDAPARARAGRGALPRRARRRRPGARTSRRRCCSSRCSAAEHGKLTVAGDDDQAVERFRGAAAKNLRDFAAEQPDGAVVRLERVAPLPAARS